MTLLVASLIDASIVLALALAVTLLLRRRSAALRHAIMATAIACATLMPAFEWLLPPVPVIPWDRGASVQSSGLTWVSGGATTGVEATDIAPAASLSWTWVIGGAWLLGSLVALTGLLTGFLRLARLRRRCAPVIGRRRAQTNVLAGECGVRRPVALFQSDGHTQPVTYGVFAPGIILPADAARWSDDRWHIVLRHELAHIARHDAALQITSELLRVLQPLNPLVWIACRRLRQESEYACDDEVLGGGVPPADYAAHLLEVAKGLSGRHVAMAAAPAIAHPSTLERRIVAMLQTTTNRTPLTRRGWYAAALAALSLSLPLAAAGLAPTQAPPAPGPAALPRPAPAPAPAQAAPRQAGIIGGQIVDQTGGVMPGVTVTLTGQQMSQPATTHTDASGRFMFRGLPAGEFTLTGTLPGFATLVAPMRGLSSGGVGARFTMGLGTLSETITVVCNPEEFSLIRALFPVLEARQTSTAPVRVGGSVRPPKKIRDVKPTCPTGIVIDDVRVALRARIDIEGATAGVELDDTEPGIAPPAELVTAAVEAVRQWRFTPTELNRQPVEVGMRVHITFTRR